ncbi:DUF4376 domain-containing protein [Salmonella enterica]|uniref:DUF4376 domain-containing protein n=1 Tax=Salmonella enterica TaxID=28901 RepID=UPI0009B13860|nr:DUF4376 domain-containing protein [Salmonella enterica]
MNVVSDVKNARYESDGTIRCDVLFVGAGQYLPFSAAKTDPDVRGKALYDELIAGTWGDIVPFTVTPEMTETEREMKRVEIDDWRDRQENTEITFELNGHRWDAGKLSLARLEPVVAVANAGQLPENFFWTDADNNDIAVTDKDLLVIHAGMLQAMVTQGFKIHERQRQMKEELDKLKTLDEIRAFSVGW